MIPPTISPVQSSGIPAGIRLIYQASCLAARLHQHQLRKDGITPYVSHLMRVPLILQQAFGCEDPVVLAAAILHDAIEDTTADYDEIAEATSAEVADLVAILTKDMRTPEIQRETDYDRCLSQAPWQARLIKLADVYDNLCDSMLSGVKIDVRSKVERALVLAGDQEELLRAVDQLRKLASPD